MLTLLIGLTAVASCGPGDNVTEFSVPFPGGRGVRSRLPSDIAAETTRRELDFYVQQGSIQALVVVTDDRAERAAAGSAGVVSVAGIATAWHLVHGESGRGDRIILSTEHWAMAIGIPDGVDDAGDVAALVNLVERDGSPVIELGGGTLLPYFRFEEPVWLYVGQRGEWSMTASSSCDDRLNMIGETSLEWCDSGRGLDFYAYGDAEFVAQIRVSLEIIVPFVDSGAAAAEV